MEKRRSISGTSYGIERKITRQCHSRSNSTNSACRRQPIQCKAQGKAPNCPLDPSLRPPQDHKSQTHTSNIPPPTTSSGNTIPSVPPSPSGYSVALAFPFHLFSISTSLRAVEYRVRRFHPAKGDDDDDGLIWPCVIAAKRRQEKRWLFLRERQRGSKMRQVVCKVLL
ncbi:hypothetical protein BDQ17DRAFT_338468 [Cyathus striatus]|nr:hypothetical protein BDQ17DRAFT_338468 [Cyathus striatus]